MASKKPQIRRQVQELSERQRLELERIKDDFAVIVRRAHAKGIAAAWVQVALWQANDRVESEPRTG